MNWEESNSCTPLKRDFLKAWFSLDQSFFLTGGSALGLFDLHHRRSYDLDFFCSEKQDLLELRNIIVDCGESIGARVEIGRTAPTFHRYELFRGEESEVLDFVVDLAPQLEQDKRQIGPIRVDTIREMIANKLVALLGRSETKDLVDLYFLEQADHDLIAALPDACEKDGGFDPLMLSMILETMRLDLSDCHLVTEMSVTQLMEFRNQLRISLADHALSP